MSTAQFRKSDQYYEDEYDRLTIELMKQRVNEWEERLRPITDEALLSKQLMVAELDISEFGTHFAQNKRENIRRRVAGDEQKDRLVAKYPLPPPPYCSQCDTDMGFFDYDFIDNTDAIQFIFSCGNGTKHNTILDVSGRPIDVLERYCPYCNGTIKTKVKRAKHKITITDSCTVCTWLDCTDFDINLKEQKRLLPISESDRKTYCTDFKNKRGFLHDLKKLADLSDHIEIKHDLSKIQMLKVADLEKRLSEALQRNQFTKLQFEPPKITSFITIRFSTLDTSDKTPQQSIKSLKRIVSGTLALTNWGLMTTEITYRLGYLTGQLKGVDQKEDLEKIAAGVR
ncbi:MAG TPA: hypothetical protein VGM63_11025 [Mucilaginibacter sp.]|jgi:hypothetical protein